MACPPCLPFSPQLPGTKARTITPPPQTPPLGLPVFLPGSHLPPQHMSCSTPSAVKGCRALHRLTESALALSAEMAQGRAALEGPLQRRSFARRCVAPRQVRNAAVRLAPPPRKCSLTRPGLCLWRCSPLHAEQLLHRCRRRLPRCLCLPAASAPAAAAPPATPPRCRPGPPVATGRAL